MAPTVCTPARGLSGESGDIRTLPRSAFVGPKTSWRRTKGAHGDQLNFLTQSKWDTWPSPSYCRSGDFSNQSGLPPSGQRAERIGRKLPRWRMKRVSAGKKEVMGAEEEAQVLSLKLSLGAMWGPGAMAQYLQDSVVIVSVKSTSSVLSTIRSILGGHQALPYSGLRYPGPQESKAAIPLFMLIP